MGGRSRARGAVTSLHGELSPGQTLLLHEVEELGRTIANAKAEIAALRVADITISYIPFAADELDAIVSHTAAATHRHPGELRDAGPSSPKACRATPPARLQDATTRIYEACGFQDLTGQRISKVVRTLQAIEAKVTKILATFGGAAAPVMRRDVAGGRGIA